MEVCSSCIAAKPIVALTGLASTGKGNDVTKGKRRNRLLAAIVVILIAVLVAAWIAGGEVPVQLVSQHVPLPELSR